MYEYLDLVLKVEMFFRGEYGIHVDMDSGPVCLCLHCGVHHGLRLLALVHGGGVDPQGATVLG